MNIVAYNPPTDHLEKTYLSKSYSAGVSSLMVKNTDRFAYGEAILIGEMGRERSELAFLHASSGKTATALPLSTATTFPHDADDPVYNLDWNKIRIYRSTTGIGGSYSVLTTVDIDVDNSDGKTYYNDPNALTTYYYQICYYNSVDNVESERTDPISATGYDPKALGTLIPETAREVGDMDFGYMSIPEYISHMNDVNDDLITQSKRPYSFLKRTAPLDIELDASTIDFPPTLWKINYLEVNEVGPAATRIFRPKKVSATEARFQLSQRTLSGDYVDEIAYDVENRQIIVVPAARSQRLDAFDLHFYKLFTRFTSLADLVETPNVLIYKLALKREFYMKKADDDDKYLKKADSYDKKYNAEVMKLQREKNIEAAGPEGLAPDHKKYIQFGGRKYRQ